MSFSSLSISVQAFPFNLSLGASTISSLPLGTSGICLETEFVLSHLHIKQAAPLRQQVSHLVPDRGWHGPTSCCRGGARSCWSSGRREGSSTSRQEPWSLGRFCCQCQGTAQKHILENLNFLVLKYYGDENFFTNEVYCLSFY